MLVAVLDDGVGFPRQQHPAADRDQRVLHMPQIQRAEVREVQGEGLPVVQAQQDPRRRSTAAGVALGQLEQGVDRIAVVGLGDRERLAHERLLFHRRSQRLG